MSYILSKREPTIEWRIYSIGDEIEGDIVFKGDYREINHSDLEIFIENRIDKNLNKIFVFNFENEVDFDFKKTDNWFSSGLELKERSFGKSWETLKPLFKNKKIIITKVRC